MPQGMSDFNFNSAPIWAVVSIALFLGVLVLLCSTVARRRQKKWNSGWFFALCTVTLVWSAATALQYLSLWLGWDVPPYLLELGRAVGMLLVPGLLYLHVRVQVSYRETAWYNILLCLVAPGVLFLLALAQPWLKNTLAPVQYRAVLLLASVVNIAYFGVAMLMSLLRILTVFHQMPQHMRRPAGYMMAGVLAYTASGILQFAYGDHLPYEVMLVAIVVVLRVLYYAFGLISSANVIVTSRELVFESLSTMVLVLNNEGRILDWNNKDNHPACLLDPRYREGYAHYRQRLLSEGKGRVSPHDENILTFPQGNGEVHYMLSVRQLDNEKRQLGFLVEISGVTKIYSVFRALEETATIDQLTGLYNRNAYLQRVGQLVAPENFPLVVLVGDVNNLKPTNDQYGHIAGDGLLVSAAQCIQQFAPKSAFAARIGGDEYVVLVPHGTADGAQAFINGMTGAYTAAHKSSAMNVGISWGYAVMDGPDEDYNEVFSQADKMMYAQKRQYARFRSSGLVPEGAVEAPPPPQEEEKAAQT